MDWGRSRPNALIKHPTVPGVLILAAEDEVLPCPPKEEEEVFVLALTTEKGTVKAFPTEPASSPTLPKPAGKSNAKRALYAICATLVPVTFFSDQPEDALDKIVVTAIWKPKPPQLY